MLRFLLKGNTSAVYVLNNSLKNVLIITW